MSSLMALLSAFAVNRLHDAAMVGVTKEAEDVARIMGSFLTSGSDKPPLSAQEFVAKLHLAHGRELMRSTRSAIRLVIWAGFASVALALLIAFYMARSIARPLEQLTTLATRFASGRTDLVMPQSRKDEIGELATAVHHMMQKRQRAEDELGLRVAERVAALAEANQALRTEITERKRGEETLRVSEEKFRQLADNITDVFWITSPDLKSIHYVSPGYELVWGFSRESLYAHPHQWVEAILPEDRDRVFAVFTGLMGNVTEVSIEYQIARRDGTARWVHDRGFQVRDAAGNLVSLTGIASDITERKRIEEALRRQQSELQVLFDLTPAMIAFKDTENCLIRVNKRYAEIFGKSVEEFAGRSVGEVHPEGADQYYSDDQEVIRSGVPKMGIVETIRDRDGKEIRIQTDKVPVCDKNGKVTGIVVMFQDVTERKRAEEALLLLKSAVMQSR